MKINVFLPFIQCFSTYQNISKKWTKTSSLKWYFKDNKETNSVNYSDPSKNFPDKTGSASHFRTFPLSRLCKPIIIHENQWKFNPGKLETSQRSKVVFVDF